MIDVANLFLFYFNEKYKTTVHYYHQTQGESLTYTYNLVAEKFKTVPFLFLKNKLEVDRIH